MTDQSRGASDAPYRGPADEPRQETVDGWISDAKDGFGIAKDTVDIIRGASTTPSAEALQISIIDSYPIAIEGKPPRLHVKLRLANTSNHGLYIEHVTVHPHQAREGHAPADVKWDVRIGPGTSDSEPWTRPVHLGPNSDWKYIRLETTLIEGTWPARDAYGLAVFRVTKLQDVAPTDRSMTFAIRR